jgi:hypothetical protein
LPVPAILNDKNGGKGLISETIPDLIEALCAIAVGCIGTVKWDTIITAG